MDGSVRISKTDRKRYLAVVKSDQRVTRAMIVLLLEQGITYAVIVSALSTSASTIARAKAWHVEGGADQVLAERRGQRADSGGCVGAFLKWVIKKCTPDMFGALRTGWTCDLLSKLMRSMIGVKCSRETMRRWLHRAGLAWRRPRPVVGPNDPQKRGLLQRIKRLLRHLPATETAVFQDEVDLNLNPEIGSMWQEKGQQTELVTPGNNVKRYLSGSLDWRTKRVYSTLGKCRNGTLFIAHLADLNRRLKHFQVVHVICDNASFHTRRAVREWVALHPRFRLLFLPKYSPERNPIERIWWHLRDEITRNHQHPTIEGLIAASLRWLKHRKHLIEGKAYRKLLAARPGTFVCAGRHLEQIISSNGGVEFSSLHGIKWLGSRGEPSNGLSLPARLKAPCEERPGCFGPNFTTQSDPSPENNPRTYYTTREVQAEVRLQTVSVTEKADGSHREIHPPKVSLFSTTDGQLTQVVFDGKPLGTGPDAFHKLAAESLRIAQEPNVVDFIGRQARPIPQVFYTPFVRAADLQTAMHVANSLNFTEDSWPRSGRGCEVFSLYDGHLSQLSSEGKFVDPERFCDTGEYVEDNWTGLLWQKEGGASGKMTYEAAALHAKRIEIGGIKGWRVPTRDEFCTIFPATFAPFTGTKYNPDKCCNDPDEFPAYWTSELDLRVGTNYAYIYQWYGVGGGNNCYTSNLGYIRCVRDIESTSNK